MEFARRRKRRRRQGTGAGKIMAGLVMACVAAYVITASAAGKWLAEKVMAPAFTALSELPVFSSNAIDRLEQEQAAEQSLIVSLSTDKSSVNADVALPAIGLYTLQMGAFSSRENAMALAENIQLRGAGGYICQDSGMYRVLAAGYSSQADARVVKDRLVSEGSDCTIYTISSPAVTFSITASEAQLEEIKDGFSALMEAQDSLAKACVDFDAESMSVEQGLDMAGRIAEGLFASCQPLEKYIEESPAISSIVNCRDQCLTSLSALGSGSYSSSTELSAQMKYVLLELSDAYSAMLKGIAG